MLANLFGPKCSRCGEKNDKLAEFCEHCGISLAFTRPAILNDNRWEAAPDELAVFFKSRDLKGLFSKPLRVPAGMRAWILQDNKAEDLQEGEYAVETLFDRLNTFFGGKHAEIIITRQAALPVLFAFNDILSADLLPVTVETTLFVRVGDTAAFRNHFMLRPGAVTAIQLNELLSDTVRQIMAESLGTRRLEEMASLGSLRQDLDRELMRGLQHRFKDFGLAFDQADTLSLRHDRFDANQQLKGSYWLEYDEVRMKAEHKKAMNELYSQEELDEIRAKEEAIRRRYRNAELKQEEAELAHVIRLREIDLYEKVVNAESREKAVDFKAREQVEFLEQQYNDRRRQREKTLLKDAWQADDARAEWLHTQEIARIRHQAESRVAEVDRNEAEKLAKQRIENTLEKIRIEGRIEQARLIEDEEERKLRLAAESELLLKNTLREQALLDARHQVAVDEITLAGEVHHRTENRVQALEDKLLEEKIAEVEGRITKAKAEGRLEGLKGLIQVNEEYELSEIRVELERVKTDLYRKREEQALQDTAEEKALDRKLKEQEKNREAVREERAHEIQHMQIFGSLPPEAILGLCDPENRDALLEYLKTKAFGEMSEGQIHAILGAMKTKEMPTSEGPFHAAPGQSTAPDTVAEEIRKAKEEQRAIFESFLAIQARSNEQSQGNLLQAGAHTKDAAIGVANAGGVGRVAADQQPSAHFAAGFAQPALKVCAGCQSVISFELSVCPQCKRPLV